MRERRAPSPSSARDLRREAGARREALGLEVTLNAVSSSSGLGGLAAREQQRGRACARRRRCAGPARAPCAATPRRPRRRACRRRRGRAVSKNSSICAGGIAPVNSSTTLPSRNALTAGIPWIPKPAASDWFWSTSTLASSSSPSRFADRGLERGAQRAARPAPLGPEVDDHGDLVRALDDALLEIALGDVEDHASSLASGASRAVGRTWRQNGRVWRGGMEDSLRGKLLVASPALRRPELRPHGGPHHRAQRRGRDGDRPQPALRDPGGVGGVPELAEIAGGEPVYVGGPVQPDAIVLLAEFSDPEAAAWVALPTSPRLHQHGARPAPAASPSRPPLAAGGAGLEREWELTSTRWCTCFRSCKGPVFRRL